MKELLKLKDVYVEIMENTLLEQMNATVKQGDIIGVIGKNGAGKSTLLQLINGKIAPTKGQLEWQQTNVTMAYVEQEKEAFTSKEVTTVEAELLAKWSVPTNDFHTLSGGEKLKIRLAKGFAQNPTLLMLDEPTNHLDENSTELLIEQIKNYSGTIIVVSHDRYFLDAVATKIWSIEDRKLIEHKGNYTSYMKAREQKRLTQQREYEKQQKNIERIESQIKELTSWSQKAHAQSTKKEGFKEYYRVKAKRTDAQVKSKQKRLEKELEKTKIERVKPDPTVEFSIQANKKVGKRFLEVKQLKKCFKGRTLFEKANFTIQHGEKIAIVGPNGCGKTTLLKMIMGQETVEGEVWISPSANIGYLTQEVFDLPLEKTPEQLFYKETFEERGKVQNVMKHLGFTSSQWKEPIKHMSMGERVKCKLMAYILDEKDVLILDEPTNHLDLPSREQLENTLAQYNGTLLIVSHDRYFLEKTANSRLVFSNNSIQKQLKEPSQKRDSLAELRLKLETERQEVLGKLSFLTLKDEEYMELDKRFKELTKQIKEL
ncbi:MULTISPECIES: ribosomal protection-like ABC-F family protein [unclassified Bacillus (in: firmicutes)]|uniref:ribosomal protection-like ABC-F family protein n=1 Tax=unclassified Bacillus (in: firmicutes) TaxID=185979 RepID=UPI0008EF5ADD|nr:MULTISPECIES: ABC-F type ribosomal protection protein [unclassified Bacillus (in: firmicutes)]SFJ74240.1 macrolide transport system ATP-binding/permease protein [Bacillus sp. 71mf]SFS69085.1 macrolide transport system ATP-binding/permease protein [Bacillus sp. 103mf]